MQSAHRSEDDPAATFVVSSMDVFGSTSPHLMPTHFFMSGTYVILDYEQVQRANAERQNFTVAPRNWYIAATITCLKCQKQFVFSVDEQKVWYEEYRFFVDSFPNKCLSCRRNARHVKQLRQQYEASITDALSNSDVVLKRKVVSVIDSLVNSSSEVPPKMLERRDTLLAQLVKLETAS